MVNSHYQPFVLLQFDSNGPLLHYVSSNKRELQADLFGMDLFFHYL